MVTITKNGKKTHNNQTNKKNHSRLLDLTKKPEETLWSQNNERSSEIVVNLPSQNMVIL